MGFKEFNEYSAEEIGLWLIAQGLGEHAPKFLAVCVDGDLLLALSVDDIKNDLGLLGLQAKKLMKNIEFAKMIGASPINKLVNEIDELEVKVQVSQHAGKTKDCEIAELRSEKLSSKHLVSRFAENVQALQHEAKTKDRKIAELRRRNIYYYRQFVMLRLNQARKERTRRLMGTFPVIAKVVRFRSVRVLENGAVRGSIGASGEGASKSRGGYRK